MPRTYFITGASSGFGHALADAVLKRGDQAILCARRFEPLKALERRYPDQAMAVSLDVTDAQSRESALEEAVKRFKQIDVLANIAGQGSLGAVEEFSSEQLREQMELNFFAGVELTQLVLPLMRQQGYGHIVNLTSIGGLVSIGGFGVYCASKYALSAWTEALRDEVKPIGLKVTLVEPGAFRTEFAGSKNMRPPAKIDAYHQIIEPLEQYLYGSDGKQPGDPAKAAQAIITVVESDNPPLHLLLGSDAVDVLEKKYVALMEDVNQWRSLSENTAFEGATVMPVGG